MIGENPSRALSGGILVTVASLGRRAWPLAASASLGAILGGALLMLGARAPLAGLGGLLLVWVAATRAELLLLLLLAFGSGLVPAQFNLSISLGVANVYLTDLLLAPLLLVLVVGLARRDGPRWRSTPLDLPVILFLLAAVGGMLTATLYQGVPFQHTTHEAHFLLYYVTYFLVTNLVRKRDQLAVLLKGALVIALLVALSMVAQALGVVIPFSPSYALRTDLGVVRLFNSGENLVSVSLFLAACYAIITASRREATLLASACVPMAAAIVVGLSRNALIAGVASMAFGLVLLRSHRLARLVGPALLAIAGVIALAWLGGNAQDTLFGQYLTIYTERFARMFSGQVLTESDTLSFRFRELAYAWPRIEASPILGIGFSVAYRPAYHAWDTLTRYIHNAYLWLWLKAGLLSLVTFVWMAWRFLGQALRRWRSLPDELLKSVVLGGGLAFMSGMLSNLVAPSFVQDWGSVVYPLLLGAVECALLGFRSHTVPIASYEVMQ